MKDTYPNRLDLPDHDENEDKKHKGHFRALILGSIGVVFGDIGTSPLYAFHTAAKQVSENGIETSEILGIVSLILWALFVIVTVKYVIFLLRNDNRGEGGILALMALAQKHVGKKMGVVFFAGVAGAALFFGDAAVTPAISVLSALDGLNLITPAFEHYVLPLGMLILIVLFSFQRHGTHKVGRFYGPVMTVWFLTLGLTGLYWICKFPIVLSALSPVYGISLLFSHGFLSFVILGSVFLAITGAEALYSDLGHFGKKPIRAAWLYFVFPCLALNYMGQGALLIANPNAVDNSFYLMFPSWALIPMVILSGIATIIASQAVITGAYSICHQAMQLGLIPRMEIQHTSESQEGQIYMPKINTLLLCAVLFLCMVFGNAAALASAYGIAVSGTMIVTTIVSMVVVARVWKKGYAFAALILLPFLIMETVFFSSNLLKLLDGAFVPLLFGLYLMLLVTVWVLGTRYLVVMAKKRAISVIDLAEMLERDPPHVVPGTAIFLTSDPAYAPETMMQNLRHNQVMHEKNIILTIITLQVPRVPIEHRLQVEPINSHIMRVVVNFGFMETPNVPAALYRARSIGYDIDVEHASFFLGHRKIVADPNCGLPMWQDKIYIALANSAVDATDYFRIPHDQVVELGTRQVV